MEYVMFNCFIYVLTLSLQLSGSAVLLLNSFSNIRVKVINDCIGGNKGLFGKNDIVNLGKKEVINSLQTIYLNRFSFGMIFVGYLISIFDSYKVKEPIKIFVVVFVTSVLFMFIAYFVSNRIANKNEPKYSYISVDNLPKDTYFYEDYGEVNYEKPKKE